MSLQFPADIVSRDSHETIPLGKRFNQEAAMNDQVRFLFALSVHPILAVLSGMAHDLWLIPPAQSMKGPVTIRAVQGMDFPKGDRAPNPNSFARAGVFLNAEAESKLTPVGTDRDAGLLNFTSPSDGIAIVLVQSNPKILKLDAEQFNSYLVSDGLPHIFQLRAKENSLNQPGVERYSKSPKAIVKIGDGRGGDSTRVIGLPLEITPKENPFAKKIGETLRVQVVFQGKSLADANLGWDHPGDGDPPSGTVRTDAKGEALIPIAKTGLMTIRLTHMTRPKKPDYEWESFWTTLTFQLPDH